MNTCVCSSARRWRPRTARRSSGYSAEVDGRGHDPGPGLVEALGGHPRHVSGGGGAVAGDEVEGPVRPGAAQLEQRVGDIVDRDHVERRPPVQRERSVGAGRGGADRPVEDVEGGGPAARLLADDDAGARDLHRQTTRRLPYEALDSHLERS